MKTNTIQRIKIRHIKIWRILPVLIIVLVFSVFFSGCATQLYYWGDFEDQQRAYLKGDNNKQGQIEALQKDLEKLTTDGKKAPPGFYAHMGMLYSDIGNDSEAIASFETEKSLFPEAAGLMDFLLKRYGR